MDKQVVVTEKPSGRRSKIAKALGGFGKSEDVYESESYILVSAAGHLLEHAKPEEPWRLDVLPLIPENLPRHKGSSKKPPCNNREADHSGLDNWCH